MMKLTYRGVSYKSRQIDLKTQTSKLSLRQPNHTDTNKLYKIVSIRPIYYTYRGVSYTKNLLFNTQSEHLLNFDRQ
jgi:hypothetical protein